MLWGQPEKAGQDQLKLKALGAGLHPGQIPKDFLERWYKVCHGGDGAKEFPSQSLY